MNTDEQRARALAGMAAAIEYARTMHGGMAGELYPAAVQEGLDLIAADCAQARPPLDILGSLAAITLRAATLACQASAAAWPDQPPLTIPQFLNELERELTPPGGWASTD